MAPPRSLAIPREDIRCHTINLTGAAAEIAYDFTSNSVGQILSEILTSSLSGEDLVRPVRR